MSDEFQIPSAPPLAYSSTYKHAKAPGGRGSEEETRVASSPGREYYKDSTGNDSQSATVIPSPTMVDTIKSAVTQGVRRSGDSSPHRNSDTAWDGFASEYYWDHNYSKLSPEDEEIIATVGDFFATTFRGQPRTRHGLDAGAGTNLYPSLLMLPWAERLTLIDYSASNVDWLRRELGDTDTTDPWSWQQFWDEAGKQDAAYRGLARPRELLRDACTDQGQRSVQKLSLFDLPVARWSLGTMFFVAESITEDLNEFRAALRAFTSALEPGAPFATAFMAGSDGYPVADVPYPAIPVTAGDVEQHFRDLDATVQVKKVELEDKVRPGYDGMIVATGFTSAVAADRPGVS